MNSPKNKILLIINACFAWALAIGLIYSSFRFDISFTPALSAGLTYAIGYTYSVWKLYHSKGLSHADILVWENSYLVVYTLLLNFVLILIIKDIPIRQTARMWSCIATSLILALIALYFSFKIREAKKQKQLEKNNNNEHKF